MFAEAVIDCTGVLSDPAPAGLGGVDAIGERTARKAGLVRYGPADCSDLAGKRVLLVGDGASAATVLHQLLSATPPADVTWVTAHEDGLGFNSAEDDPLPGRRALFQDTLNARSQVTHAPLAWVTQMTPIHSGLSVTLDGRDEPVDVDMVVACTGFRPDLNLHRELQVHACYASEGPMKLAAALLGDSGGDCLAPKASGPELLMNPEPQFFVLGAKSYGRRNDFLLRTGHAQVEQVASLLA
jgi:cation diffusion facilitator CzcD-associated flavoprotein CzcO